MSDFRIQRGTFYQAAGTSETIYAGYDYIPPRDLDRAFVRVVEGARSSVTGDDLWRVSNPGDLLTSITFERDGSGSQSYLSWEIIEYVGPSGGPNEFVVRGRESISVGSGDTVTNGSVVSGVVDDSDVMTLVTGSAAGAGAGVNQAERVWHTAEWDSGNQRPVVTRGASGSAVNVSVAVIEWVGSNWTLTDIDVDYTTARTVQNVGISVDRTKTIIFDELRFTAPSSGSISPLDWTRSLALTSDTNLRVFFGNGDDAVEATVHVWILENAGAGDNPMSVEWLNGTISAATDPVDVTITDAITKPQGTSYFWRACPDRSATTQSTIATNALSVVEWLRPLDTLSVGGDRYSVGSDDLDYGMAVIKWPGIGVRTEDFKVQTLLLPVNAVPDSSSTTVDFDAGVWYEAPDSASSAFVRLLGVGLDRGSKIFSRNALSDQPGRNCCYIHDQADLTTSFGIRTSFDSFATFPDNQTAIDSILVEIVEYVGDSGGANEFVVRGSGAISLGTSAPGDLTGDTGTISGVVDDGDVVVWATGWSIGDNLYGSRMHNIGATWEWVGASNVARMTREAAGDTWVGSCVVVEFTGSNWTVQRVTGSIGTAPGPTDITISSVDADQAFVHHQCRYSSPGISEEDAMTAAWVHDATNVRIWTGPDTRSSNTDFVVWVISNSGSTDPMDVERLLLEVTQVGGFDRHQYTDSPTAGGDLGYASLVNGTCIADTSSTSLLNSDFAFAPFYSGGDITYVGYNDDAFDKDFRVQKVRWPGAVVSTQGAASAVGASGLVNAGLVNAGLVNAGLVNA